MIRPISACTSSIREAYPSRCFRLAESVFELNRSTFFRKGLKAAPAKRP